MLSHSIHVKYLVILLSFVVLHEMKDRIKSCDNVRYIADICSMSQNCKVNHATQRYPFCIVWTPIPLLTWLLPFIGHMGIATAVGVIRDFAGPYYVGTDNMGFGKPTKYWQLNPDLARGGAEGWDRAVFEASEEYKNRNHNLLFDNCHSHVALALNMMGYKDFTSWNMIRLAFLMVIHGQYVGFYGFAKTWVPFFIIFIIILSVSLFL